MKENTHDDMLILLFCLGANSFNLPGRRDACVCVCACVKGSGKMRAQGDDGGV